eukprot:TRINITY_DN74795_c0_g1_i1.p1 TRINITY_DN74795_c0_g1~~TRINITY_DN74795_c0_g1_i1.p1  ORF type:complete len:279 (-),score=37.61 TRINITY_DN74795_c0_g1_i1:277-1113(-)
MSMAIPLRLLLAGFAVLQPECGTSEHVFGNDEASLMHTPMHSFRSSKKQANSTEHEILRRTARSSASKISFYHRMEHQIELELAPVGVLPMKNKLLLAIIELTVLGICGVDRCYMGQLSIGLLKGCTMGGCLVWLVLDWIMISLTMLSWSTTINTMGYRADFEDDWTISAAGALTIIALVFECSCGVWRRNTLREEPLDEKLDLEELPGDFAEMYPDDISVLSSEQGTKESQLRGATHAHVNEITQTADDSKAEANDIVKFFEAMRKRGGSPTAHSSS